MNNTVHRDIDPDPDSEREDNGKSKSRRFAELPKREFEIVHITRRVAPESDQPV